MPHDKCKLIAYECQQMAYTFLDASQSMALIKCGRQAGITRLDRSPQGAERAAQEPRRKLGDCARTIPQSD